MKFVCEQTRSGVEVTLLGVWRVDQGTGRKRFDARRAVDSTCSSCGYYRNCARRHSGNAYRMYRATQTRCSVGVCPKFAVLVAGRKCREQVLVAPTYDGEVVVADRANKTGAVRRQPVD